MTCETVDPPPAQYYLAEDLNPEWLEYQRTELEEQLAVAAGGGVLNLRSRLACNELEMGINQGSRKLAENAFDDFDRLAKHHEFDLHYICFFKARVLLATKETFYARVRRELPSSTDMQRAFTDSMNVLNEAVTVNTGRARDFDIMSDLITFGAIARLQQPDYFPYFSTFRERDDPSNAAHDEYVLASIPGQLEPYKDPISLRTRVDNPHNLACNTLFHQLAKEHSEWFQDMGAGFFAADVKPKRFSTLARLLIWSSRYDSSRYETEHTILESLSNKFSERIAGEAPA